MTTWTASSVVIKGAGASSTTASGNWTITALKTIPFEIKDLTLSGDLTLAGQPSGFKIHDCIQPHSYVLYINWGGSFGHPWGVVYQNTLHKVSVIPTASNRFDEIHALFRQTPPLGGVGTADNGIVYIEGNTYPTRGTGYLTDSENGGRMVFRFNTIEAIESSANLALHGINPDAIGSYAQRGTQIWEYYNNKYTNSVYSNTFTQFRSGTGVFWNNDIYRAGSGMSAIHIDNPRSIYYASYNYMCRGDYAWDGNLTIDYTQASLVTNYGDTATPGGDPFTGTHTGTESSTVLTDSAKNWNTNKFVKASGYGQGVTIYNTTTGKGNAWCWPTANTATTATCTLSGSQVWANGDTYRISDGYPCRDQIGHGYYDTELFDDSPITPNAVQSLMPMYIWNNKRNGTLMNTVSVSTTGSNKLILSNRDYYTMQGASCTAGGACTTGVGSGTTPPTTCTVGTAFWRTDESKLYKCTATNTWTLYYQAATCPHPLADPGAVGSCDYTKYGTDGYTLTEDPPPPDTTPPVISDLAPSGSVAYTPTVTLTAITDEPATCRYHATSTTWASMTEMSGTGLTNHSQSVNVSVGANSFKIVCQDDVPNESSASTWSFTIGAVPGHVNIGGTPASGAGFQLGNTTASGAGVTIQ
jgi:hypothetical protein